MGEESGISWTKNTMNFWTGCVKVSPGCKHCYAKAWMARSDGNRSFGDVRRTGTWDDPPKWQKRLTKTGGVEMVFTCSLSDFLIVDADAWRPFAWDIMQTNDRLIWQVLSKRLDRIPELDQKWFSNPMPNCWLGTSAENQDRYDARMPMLELYCQHFPVAMLSLEPLLGPIELNLKHWASKFKELWVIAGAESGGDRRPFKTDWVSRIIDQCDEFENVTFYFKQGSGFKPDRPCGIPAIDGRKSWPVHLQTYAGKMKVTGQPVQQLLL